MKILWKMEHLLQKSECSIFLDIFKNVIFQRRQKALLWGKGLKGHINRILHQACNIMTWPLVMSA